MVYSKTPNRLKKQDQTPILVNDFLEENVFASEDIQYEEPSKLDILRDQQNGNIPYIQDHIHSSESNNTSSIDMNSTTLVNSSSLRNAGVSVNNGTTDGFETYETLVVESSTLEGVDCGCCRIGGRITRLVFGNAMAFFSGLFFTANNFIIKAARLSFGELLAVRSIIQIPLVSLILFMKGESFWPTSWYHRVMLCMIGLFGSLTMLTSFACVKYMPVPDAITLIFTAPLFTMVLAAIFMKEKITIIKTISGIVLMAGILLVTKPSFIFQNETNTLLNGSWIKANATKDWRHDYEKGIFFLFDLKTPIPPEHDPEDYYFIGALVALSCAIFGGALIVICSKIGSDVSTQLQLLSIAVFAFFVAGFVQFLDERDRFFSPKFVEITVYEWGLYLGISCLGMLGYLFEFQSCKMIPPGTVATLRTTEIVVAFVAQVIFTHIVPEFIDILGAAFVFIAAIVLIFEKNIHQGLSRISCDVFRRSTSTINRLVEEPDDATVTSQTTINE